MGKISIVRTKGGIGAGLEEALRLIGGLKQFAGRNDRVLLKPNLNGTEGCTSLALTEALVRLLGDSGVREVFIAESAFGPSRNTDRFFRQTGYAGLAQRYGIRLINLNESKPVELAVKNPLALHRIKIAQEVLEADRIINLPSMKVHYATGVTLSLKNLKGCLVGDEKRRFHEIGLDRAIADLNRALRADLNIIDGTSCMERMGPRGGDLFSLDLLIAGADRAEVDSVGCRIMGFEIEEVKHLKYYLEANRIDLKRVQLAGKRIEQVRRPFKKASLQSIIPPQFRVHDRNACSACMNALLLSFRLLPSLPEDRLDVFLGTLIDENEPAGGVTLAFGNCCPADREFGLRIRGCPPYPFALGEALKDL